MAVTQTAFSVVMTALADTITDAFEGRLRVTSIRLVGTDLLPGHRLTIRNRASATGPLLVDHYVREVNEDVELWQAAPEGEWIDRPYLSDVPTVGTWSVIFRVRPR